jgi:hypothetical protein
MLSSVISRERPGSIFALFNCLDLFQKTEESEMCQTMRCLLKQLRRQVSRIVLLTLPPIPKIQFRPDHWEKIESFNWFLKSLEGTSYSL